MGTLLTASAVIGIAANLVFGRLADRFPRRALIWAAQLPLAAGLVALALEVPVQWLIPLAMLGGIAQGLTALWTATLGDRFAPESFGSVMGAMGFCMLPFTMAGVQFPISLFATSGRFELAFGVFAALLVAAGAAIALLGPKRAST